jgi:hypothetical protein
MKNHLLDINYIKKHTPNIENLKVTLVKNPKKGTSLVATKPIRKGGIIAYYLIKIYNISTFVDPYNDVYTFTVYKKDGKSNNKLIGNLFEGNLPPPKRNIPFWAYFSNEPSNGQTQNSYIDINLAQNYRYKNTVKEGDTLVYKLVAARNIKPGEEIVWCYGDEYRRTYTTTCNI